MLRVEAVFVEDGAGQVAEAVAGLPAFVAEAAQGHQEHSVRSWLGGVAAPREQKRIASGDVVQLEQQLGRLARQRYQMFAAALHPLGRDQPQAGIEVELLPACFAQLRRATGKHRQQLQADAHVVGMGIGANGTQQCRQLIEADVGEVLHRLGE
ncbi:hypothetical protein D3C78_1207350 [compost metagenome]